MATLAEPIKVFIVQRLACFDSPKTIADAVKEEYNVTIPRQQVEEYDPEKRKKLPAKWCELHKATRDAFLAETAREPAAERAVRIRRLARMAEKAESKGNIVLAASLYEQIAKERGGMFTNRRELTGRGGGPIAGEFRVRFVRPGAPDAGR